VVALDVEKVFDRVNHDKLRRVVKRRVADRGVWPRIERARKAGALPAEGREAPVEGPPQGGPVSPLLTNLLRDGRDQEWARRGHRFGRDADDCHSSVTSVRAGPRVLARVPRCLARRLTVADKGGGPAGAPDVAGRHLHRAAAEPAPGA
jgi:RNA-directed DNA polymerase